MSKLTNLGFSGPYNLNADGSVNAIFKTYPYHIHETATPEAWMALQADLADASSGVVLVPYVEPVINPAEQLRILKSAASAALNQSDTVVIRCAEAGVAVPQDWKDYRSALRAIISGTAIVALPVKPAYPAGT
jgi:hypothetical protein